MNLLTLLKILGIVIVVMTSIILPLSILESSIADLTAEFIEWSGESKFLNSILLIAALTGDVFLPIPNGITNTFAGAPAKVLVIPFGIGKNTSPVNAAINKIEFKNLLSPLHSINSAVKSAIEDSSIESGNIIEVITTMTIPSIFKRVKRFIYISVYIKA